MSAASSSSTSMPESMSEGPGFSESNNILLMALMEETQEDQYYADDRLMSMIQSLEAELSSTSTAVPNYQSYEMEVGQMDDQDCSTSSVSFSTTDHWDDMEVVSASSSSSSSSSCSFDEEMMNAWSLCAAGGDDIGDYSSEFYYGVLLENCLPQETSDVVF